MPYSLRRVAFALLAVVIPLGLAPGAQAQQTLTLADDSQLWIDGTSNKNDWTVYAEALSGSVQMRGDAVEQVELTVPSADLASRKSTIMDRLMHQALTTDDHPAIVYTLTKAVPEGAQDGALTLRTTGTLTLAGVTNEVVVPVSGERMADGRVRFTGTHPLLMTDYGIRPPTAMFGALRTGDEVIVHFDLIAAPAE